MDRASWRARLRAAGLSPWAAPVVGVALTLVSLGNGLAFDDLMHRLRAQGAFGATLGERLDLFTFVSSDPAQKARLVDSGFVPWFAAPDLRLAFFRPLAAALGLFDYTTLGRWPWAMHLESVALYGAVIAIVAAAYRRFLPAPTAALAALLFAIDDAHGMPVGWLANRNALLATAFGVAAVIAHDRWRREGRRAGAALGTIAFALALLSAEIGLAALGYLVAYAITIDPAPRARRAVSLAPYAAVAIAWQIAYRALGYGARASGVYLDPIAAPGEYLRALPGHVAALVLGEIALPPSDLYVLASPLGKGLLVALAAVVVAFVAWALARRWRGDAATRFFALGALFALAPVTPTFPADRLLILAGLGGSALVARVVAEPLAPALRRERVLRGAWMAIHLVLAPILLLVTSTGSRVLASTLQRMADRVEAPPALARQTLVFVNSPAVLIGFTWMFPDDPSRAAPARMRGLSSSTGRVALEREDARTLLVTTDPEAPSDPSVVIFRDEAHPIREGDAFDVPGMHAAIVRVDRMGRPFAIRYRFDVPLEDASLRWVAWDGASYVDFAPPAIGARASVGPS